MAPALPLTLPADRWSVSRASWYYRPRPPQPATVALQPRIDAIDTATPCYGSRRLTGVPRQEGCPVHRKRGQTAMRVMGLQG